VRRLSGLQEKEVSARSLSEEATPLALPSQKSRKRRESSSQERERSHRSGKGETVVFSSTLRGKETLRLKAGHAPSGKKRQRRASDLKKDLTFLWAKEKSDFEERGPTESRKREPLAPRGGGGDVPSLSREKKNRPVRLGTERQGSGGRERKQGCLSTKRRRRRGTRALRLSQRDGLKTAGNCTGR